MVIQEEAQSRNLLSSLVLHSRQLVNKLKRYVKDLPFLLLAIDGVWWVLSFFGIWSVDYWFIGEIFSHSLSFTIVMAFYAYLHRYCLYSWVCIIGLGLVNLCNLCHYFFNFEYHNWYMGLIIFTCLIFASIKWKQQTYSKAY